MSIRRPKFNRRDFCAIAASTFASAAIGSACHGVGNSVSANGGRLTARVRDGVKTTPTGQIMLGLDRDRDAILQLPKTASQSPLPLLVMLHGDHILPIDRCGRRIAIGLRARGYDVTFREFEGDHEIPADIARAGLHFIRNNLQLGGVSQLRGHG